MTSSDSNFSFCVGDTHGKVFDTGEVVKRVCKGNDNYPQDIYTAYLTYNFAEYGIVQTSYSAEDRTFTHKRHKISYPHEWPPTLFKDVVLFHLDLLIHLGRYGFTLKDALPENILLDGVRPVFVDFTSLIREEELSGLNWLMAGSMPGIDPRLRVLQLMFVPHMLLPLIMYASKNFDKGRRLLAELYCNNTTGTVANWDVVPQVSLINRLSYFLRQFIEIKTMYISAPFLQFTELRQLCSDPSIPWYKRIERLRIAVEALDVMPSSSGYESYYADKAELFGVGDSCSWGEKQRNVYRVFSDEHPATVLDLGANTGWFSRLACSMGADVIAADIDIRSIDILYKEARLCKLALTPLWMSFDDLTLEHFSLNDSGRQNLIPVHMAATKRLRSDIVLCLGLLHHLILGIGKTIEEVFHVLSQLTRSVLIIEYVDLNDELIKSEPSFFRNLSVASDLYSLEHILTEGKKHFATVDILASHPSTRHLLVFKK